MSENEKESKVLIDKVLNITDSKKEVEELDNTKEFNLVKLLNGQIERNKSKHELKESTIAQLNERLSDQDEKIPAGLLIRLLEVLDRSDTDLSLGIINAGKDLAFTKAFSKRDNEESLSFSKEDVELVKKLLKSISFLETLTKSEGS